MSTEVPKKILVIEDEPTQRILAKEFLELAGYSVRSSDDGLHGLNMAVKTLPDLIMLDLMLPSIDGYELCSKLKQCEDTAHIPVILFTGSKDPDVIKRGLEVGADDFIIKPIDWQFLEDRVSFVLNRCDRDEKAAQSSPDLEERQMSDAADLQEQFVRIQALQEAANAANNRLCEIETEHEEALRRAHMEAQTAVDNVESEAQAEIEALTAELDRSKTSFDAQLDDLRAQHQSEIERLTADFEAKTQSEKERFDTERRAAQDRHAYELALANEIQSETSQSEELDDTKLDQISAIWHIVAEQCMHHEDSLEKISALLPKNIASEPDQKRLIKISKETDRISHAVCRLKKLANIATDQNEVIRSNIDTNEFLNELADRVKRIAEKRNVTLNVQPLAEPCSVSMEPHRIRYALTLLITNALRLTPPAGQITLSASLDEEGCLRLSVSDNGVGISPNELQQNRQCLDKAPSPANGSGHNIGLEFPIVTALARKQEVDVELDARQGEGLSASLVFPCDAVVVSGDGDHDLISEADVAC